MPLLDDMPLPEPPRDEELFEGGRPRRLEQWLHVPSRVSRKAALIAAVAWLPLLALSAVETVLLKQDALRSFAFDLAVHARCLVTIPLFVLAEAIVSPQLGVLAQRFLDGGLVKGDERACFDAAVASTRRLRDSPAAELLVIVVVFALLGALVPSAPSAGVPAWQRAGGGELPGRTPAGWWHLLVSRPLLLILFLSWLWRLGLWARFLW